MISNFRDSICYATRINSIEDADHICNGVKPQSFVFVCTEHLKCLTKIFGIGLNILFAIAISVALEMKRQFQLRKYSHYASNFLPKKVVVTGIGLVTCLGVGKDYVWNKLIQGHCGITKVKGQGYEQIPSKVAGYVPRGNNPGELDIDSHIAPADQRVMSLASCYAVVAADEALSDARWKPESKEERERTGVAVGTGMVSMEYITDVGTTLREQGYRRVSPHFMTLVLVNMAAGHISIRHGLQGPNHAVSTACTTGLHAIGDAARFIQNGDADVMVAGGTESSINPLSIAGFARMRALSTNFNDNPKGASRPFDKDRDGFVMSEGAGVVVLEELSHAEKRGANIYGEILGYGLSGDAYHITAPSNEGIGAYNCMKSALKNANIPPDLVGYINAHATSTPLGDEAECKAIWELIGICNKDVVVSSTKGATGHLLGAAGSVEAIFTILACQSGKIPPTLNLNQSDIDLDLKLISKIACDWSNRQRVALSNSFGFGGTNASLCIGNFIKE